MLIHWIGNTDSIIDTIYSIASYTYGPLLGMYAFGLFTRRKVRDKLVPFVAIASPLFCFGINQTAMTFFNYTFGYELLIINGMITFTAMWVLSMNHKLFISNR